LDIYVRGKSDISQHGPLPTITPNSLSSPFSVLPIELQQIWKTISFPLDGGTSLVSTHIQICTIHGASDAPLKDDK